MDAMACPHGGCINGGGAISTRSTYNEVIARETPTEMRQQVKNTLHYLELLSRPLYSGKLNDYHVVPKMQHTLGATAGVKVEDMQW